MSTRSAVTNQAVADRIGITHSAVSRIRSGDRLPSFDVMRVIAEVYGWDLQSQSDARILGSYASEFEAVLAREHV